MESVNLSCRMATRLTAGRSCPRPATLRRAISVPSWLVYPVACSPVPPKRKRSKGVLVKKGLREDALSFGVGALFAFRHHRVFHILLFPLSVLPDPRSSSQEGASSIYLRTLFFLPKLGARVAVFWRFVPTAGP